MNTDGKLEAIRAALGRLRGPHGCLIEVRAVAVAAGLPPASAASLLRRYGRTLGGSYRPRHYLRDTFSGGWQPALFVLD